MGKNSDIFQSLQQRVIECRLCPRLVQWRERMAREKVRRFRMEEYWGRPVPSFGCPDAMLIIVGLAPGAHGANRTGRLFTGDRSGDWLFEALHRYGFANQPTSARKDDGLALQNCLITAAVRCAPPDNKPLPEEITNCRVYLREELSLAETKHIIITLGLIAFRSFLAAWEEGGGRMPDGKLQFAHGREWSLGNGLVLISCYHPSQQNTQTGRLTREMFHRIFKRARKLLTGDKVRLFGR